MGEQARCELAVRLQDHRPAVRPGLRIRHLATLQPGHGSLLTCAERSLPETPLAAEPGNRSASGQHPGPDAPRCGGTRAGSDPMVNRNAGRTSRVAWVDLTSGTDEHHDDHASSQHCQGHHHPDAESARPGRRPPST
jgi:hypothetical protein